MSEVSNNAQTEQAASDTQEKPNLTLQDLSMMVQILQVGTSRGTWKADELSSVGGLYDRITAFLTAAGVVTKTDTNETQPEDGNKD
jgi:hypothetical protein